MSVHVKVIFQASLAVSQATSRVRGSNDDSSAPPKAAQAASHWESKIVLYAVLPYALGFVAPVAEYEVVQCSIAASQADEGGYRQQGQDVVSEQLDCADEERDRLRHWLRDLSGRRQAEMNQGLRETAGGKT